MDLLEQEIKLEEDARKEHQAAWLTRQQDSIRDGNAKAVQPLQHLMIQAFPKVREAMQDIINSTSRGYGAQYRTYLRELGANACSTLALSMAMQMACEVGPFTQALSLMGKAVVAELIYRRGEKQGAVSGAYVHRVREKLQRNGTKDVGKVHSMMTDAAKNISIELDTLPPRALITLGKLMMQAVSITGLVVTARHGGGPRMRGTAYLELHPDIKDYVGNWLINARPHACYPPMIIPPKQINPDGIGGLWHSPGQFASYRVISRMRHAAWRRLGIDPTPVIEQCMMLSSAPYRVNTTILELLKEHRYDVMGLPRLPKEPPLPFAVPEGVPLTQYISQYTDELKVQMQEAASAWRVDRAVYHKALKEFTSTMRSVNAAVAEATKYAAYDHVYLPTFADTRGRVYYASHLNPQGVDAQRALLELADPVPLGEDGLHWLKVHVANCSGYDSEKFSRRAEYVDQMLPRLREACRAPLMYESFWAAWDLPLCGYAAARELIEAIDSGNPAEYPSRVITQWDATCSGLQHLSAMIRDEVGGRAVNLIDSPERKADIYGQTASVTLQTVQADLATGVSAHDKSFLEWLLEAGIDRSLAKKPVMTLVYGATNRGMADYFAAHFRTSGVELKPGMRLHKVAMTTADLMFDMIPKVVPRAVACMQWLQNIAAAEAAAGRYMEWPSPTGLRVVNVYEAYHETNMNIKLLGVHTIKIRQYKNKPDGRRAAMAAVPNFVHTMDAAHLNRVVWAMWNYGVYIASVHDSIGCAAAHAGTLHRVIREEFVKLYENFDPIGELAERYGVEAPERGNLDIREVLNSSHFFC